ncbi:MAG: methyltransferase domain-containing protein [Acidimicrobiia bacterium]|nr:methyltransferase domain-containing protein [Acidimicrobiia bacterium]
MKRIGILVVAYNAATTLAAVLDRIPTDFRPRISGILVSDDHSQDDTYLVGLGYQQLSDLPLTVVRTPKNLGYGGNQKLGYRWAIENQLDVVVLLHGDGQYAPEFLPSIVAPLEDDSADAVFGSRMLETGQARRGGMPLYKYLGNKVLSRFENVVAGANLSEWHSGYRAYSTKALAAIPFERNDDGFNFDTQIIVNLLEAGMRLAEVPIPTYYGDEICYVNGMKYAVDITHDVVRYRLHKMGFGSGETAFASAAYEEKHGPHSSHAKIERWTAQLAPVRVLDLGCSDGALAARLRAQGHHVTGVDLAPVGDVESRVDRFVQADLDGGIPEEVGEDYDLVLAADVLEHVRRPERVLADARRLLRPDGRVMVSIPNFAHWYPRARVALGAFDYDRRGILDRTHVRFFTRRSFLHLVEGAGFTVRRQDTTGLPLEVAERGAAEEEVGDAGGRSSGSLLQRLDRLAVRVRPTLFAYQFLFDLAPILHPSSFELASQSVASLDRPGAVQVSGMATSLVNDEGWRPRPGGTTPTATSPPRHRRS